MYSYDLDSAGHYAQCELDSIRHYSYDLDSAGHYNRDLECVRHCSASILVVTID